MKKRYNTTAVIVLVTVLSGQFTAKSFTISARGSICTRKTPLLAKRDPRLDELRQEREKELLELGGDPFFLTDDDLLEGEETDNNDEFSAPSMSLLGGMSAGGGVANIMGGKEAEGEVQVEPDFLWDGESDDSAYFD